VNSTSKYTLQGWKTSWLVGSIYKKSLTWPMNTILVGQILINEPSITM